MPLTKERHMTESPSLVSLNECARMTSLSRTAINRWRLAGKFPEQVDLGTRRVAFVRSEVEQWINERINERARRAVA
jgi:prophage regulatory protein